MSDCYFLRQHASPPPRAPLTCYIKTFQSPPIAGSAIPCHLPFLLSRSFLIVIAWAARHIHIALDTIVLYGVLGAPAREMDERASSSSSDPVVSGKGSRSSSKPECSNVVFRI
ncbi:unnamed protein product [Ectocarpus sp. 12 AP-2014]